MASTFYIVGRSEEDFLEQSVSAGCTDKRRYEPENTGFGTLS